ncbi:MAG: MarC family protein [Spirochaetia bacterium]
MTWFTAVFTLFFVMDPFGNIPVFLSFLKNMSPKRRKLIIIREMLIAALILCMFLFFGNYLLSAIHISESALSLSGGVVLFIISLKMIFPQEEGYFGKSDEEPVIVPLAMPLIAGPSTMAMVILLSSQYPDRILLWLSALLTSWFACSVILLAADLLSQKLGERTLKAIERLMGMILTTMSIQMLLSGITSYLESIGAV